MGLDQFCGDGAQLAGALVQNGADGGVGVGGLGGVGKRGCLHALAAYRLQDVLGGQQALGRAMAQQLGVCRGYGNNGADLVLHGEGGADGIIREEHQNALAGTNLGRLGFGAEDGRDGGGDHHGYAELEAQALGNVHAVPVEVFRGDQAVIIHGAGGGHAEGDQAVVQVGHHAVDAGHDVLEEVILAEVSHRGGQFLFAQRAALDVIKADVGLLGAHGDSAERPVIIGRLKRHRWPAAPAGLGEVGAFLDEARVE